MAAPDKSLNPIFADDSYLAGQPEAPKEESIDQRSWPRAVADFGLTMAEQGVEAGRSFVTVPGRYAEEAPGEMTKWDERLRDAGHYIEQFQSSRARAAKRASLDPAAGEVNAMDMPGAVLGHHAAALAPWLIVGALGSVGSGGTLPAVLASAAAWGGMSVGDYAKSIYDMVDKIPSEAFRQLPQAQPFLQETNGDERAARKRLAEASMKSGEAILAGAGGALGGGVLGHAVAPMAKAGSGIVRRTAVGAAEGLAGMEAQSVPAAINTENAATRVGLQDQPNYNNVQRAMVDAVLPSIPIAGMHAVRRNGIDPAQELALSDALNKGQPAADEAQPAQPQAEAPMAPQAGAIDVGPRGSAVSPQQLGMAGAQQARADQARAAADADMQRRQAVADQIKIRNPMWDKAPEEQAVAPVEVPVEPGAKGEEVKQVAKRNRRAKGESKVEERPGDTALETVTPEGAPVTPTVTGAAPLELAALQERAPRPTTREKLGDELDGFVAYRDQPVEQQRVVNPAETRADVLARADDAGETVPRVSVAPALAEGRPAVQRGKVEVQYRAPEPSERTVAERKAGEAQARTADENALKRLYPKREDGSGKGMTASQRRSHQITKMFETGQLEAGLPVRSEKSDRSEPLSKEYEAVYNKYKDELRDYRVKELGEEVLSNGVNKEKLLEIAAKPGEKSAQAESVKKRREEQVGRREEIAREAHGAAWQKVAKTPDRIMKLIRDAYMLSAKGEAGSHLTDRTERSTAVGTARFTTQEAPLSRLKRSKVNFAAHSAELTDVGNMVAKIAKQQVKDYNKAMEKAQRDWHDKNGRKKFKFDENHEVFGTISSSRSGKVDSPWYAHVSRQYWFAREWDKLVAKGEVVKNKKGEATKEIRLRPQDEGAARGLIKFYIENELSGAEGARNFRDAENQEITERKTQQEIRRETAGPKYKPLPGQDIRALEEDSPYDRLIRGEDESTPTVDKKEKPKTEEIETPEEEGRASLDEAAGVADEQSRVEKVVERTTKPVAVTRDIETLGQLRDTRREADEQRAAKLQEDYLGKLAAEDPFHQAQRRETEDFRLLETALRAQEEEFAASKDTTKPLIEARAKEQIPDALKSIAGYLKHFTGGAMKVSRDMRKKFPKLPAELDKVKRTQLAADIEQVAREVANGKRTVREGLEHLLEVVDVVPHNEVTGKILDKAWEAVAPWAERPKVRTKDELMAEASERYAKTSDADVPTDIKEWRAAQAEADAARRKAEAEAAASRAQLAKETKGLGISNTDWERAPVREAVDAHIEQWKAHTRAEAAEAHTAAVKAVLDPKSDLTEYGIKTQTAAEVIDQVLPYGNALHKYFNSVARRLTSGVTVAKVSDKIFDAAVRQRQPDMADRAVSDVSAYYDWKTDRIVVRDSIKSERITRTNERGKMYDVVTGGMEQALRHELGHAITEGAFRRYKNLGDNLDQLRQEAMRQLGIDAEALKNPDNYGFRSKEEFLSELWSNPEFAEMLSTVPLPKGWAGKAGAAERREGRLMTVLKGAYNTILRALYNAFGHRPARNVLERGLLESAEVFRVVENRGRPKFGGRREDAPDLRFLISDRLKEAGLKPWHEAQKALDNMRGPFALWSHTFHDLTKRDHPEFQRKMGDYKDIVSRMNAAAEQISRERGDGELLKKVARFTSLPDATVKRGIEFLYKESHHKWFADRDLDPKKKFPDYYTKQHGELRKELDELNKIPGFADMRKALHEWGDKTQGDLRRAKVGHTVEMLDLVKNADGTLDPVAHDALVKHILRDKTLTSAEQAWIEKQRPEGTDKADVERAKFDRLVATVRSIPEFKKIAGPYLPHMRRGEYVLSGRYVLPETQHGEKVKDKNDRDTGRVTFTDQAKMEEYATKVATEMGLTELARGRTVFDKRTNKPATRWTDDDTSVIGNAPGEPGYVQITRGHDKRLSVKDFEENPDPNHEIRHWVSFGNKHFSGYETKAEAMAAHRAFHEAGKVSKDGSAGLELSYPEQMKRDEAGKVNIHQMSDELATFVERVMKSEAYRQLTDAQQHAWANRLNQEVAHTIQGMGGRSPLLPREYAQGESHDLLQNYLEATGSTARTIAHAQHGNELYNKGQEIQKWVDARRYSTGTMDQSASDGHTLRDAVWKEAQARVYRNLPGYANRGIPHAINRLVQATYLAKLVGTSFLGINAAEPTIIGGPLLAGKYGAGAFNTLAKSYSIIGGGRLMRAGLSDFAQSFKKGEPSFFNLKEMVVKNIGEAKGLSDREKKELASLMDGLVERGLLDMESVNEVSLLKSAKSSMLGRGMDKVDVAFRGLNGAVETINRAVIAATAYMEERKKNPTGDVKDAQRAAYDMVYDAAGNYAAWNAPPPMNNAWLRPMMQFKKYPQRIAANYIRAVAGSFGKGPEAAEARKRLMYMFAMQSAVSGLLGLPTEPVTAVINAGYIAGISPINSEDAEAQARKLMADWFGPEAGTALAHGGLNALTGGDFAGRLGHNNLLFFGAPASSKPKDWLLGAAHILGGAPLDTATKILGGAGDIAAGAQDYAAGAHTQAYERFGQGVRKMNIIRQLNDIYDAVQKQGDSLYTETPTGKRIGTKLTTGEAIWKGLGVTPTRESYRGEARRTEQRQDNQFNERRAAEIARWVHAEPSEKGAVWRSIQNDFNRGLEPVQQINGKDLAKAMSTYIRNKNADDSSLGLSPSKRTKPINEAWNKVYGIN